MMQLSKILSLFKQNKRDAGWFCIAIGVRGVHFVRMQRSGEQLQVAMCEFFPMANVTSSALEKAAKDLALGSFQFTTLLAPDEYQMLMVDAPNVPVDELKNAIRYRIKDSLNCHVDDATVDVLQIPSSGAGGTRPQSLYAIAAANNLIQKRITLFEKAKINLSVIDIPEMAQRNIAALYEAEGRGLALLVFDERGGLLTFTSGGELYVSRRLEITAGQIRDADEELRTQYFDRVELEVQRSLDYFDRQFHQIALSRMLVCAPGGDELVHMLSSNLGVQVETFDLTQVMDISAVPALLDDEFVSASLPAIGAALRQERRAL
jgi:MSHA biogenesis protein MshI